jgi:membrane-bound lytic murein transglycosylase MltF
MTTHRFLILVLFAVSALRGETPDASKAVQAKAQSSIDAQKQSLRKQRDSLRQQLGIKEESTTADFEFVTSIAPLIVSDCPRLEDPEVESLIAVVAKKEALSPQLLRAIMRQESGFKPCAVSIKGAQGLMQLMPATSAQFHVTDPFDPEQNVRAGAAFLRQLLKKYNGDLRLALVAYNAGPLRADQLTSSQYPQETQGYLASIFAEIGTPSEAESPQ